LEPDKELSRRAEALRLIYCNKGLDLTQDEARQIAEQSWKQVNRQAILFVLLMLALIAFLMLRFVR
jgi:hypothetical protein